MAKTKTRRILKRKTTTPRHVGGGRRVLQVLLIFVASAIVVDGLVGDRGLVAMLRARQDFDRLTAAVERQRVENDRLREQARRLRDDPAAVEEIARRELGLIRPGEKVFILKDVPPPSQHKQP